LDNGGEEALLWYYFDKLVLHKQKNGEVQEQQDNCKQQHEHERKLFQSDWQYQRLCALQKMIASVDIFTVPMAQQGSCSKTMQGRMMYALLKVTQ